ncbi:MAG: phospholipid carrier-dependent glycosyltransferase, partial [Planctomycetia bacterium]|nr:phospholipid carrier-dependent glycosyltransferase [Planctomycetia bacterium]
LAGVNETGARLPSALLTLGTCLLAWRTSHLLFGPAAGLWAGLTLATCLWTGITGRAATPDAPLAFCTTLALWLFVRGARVPGADGFGWRHGPVRLSSAAALGVGAACGLAVLAKGPVGLVLPVLAFVGFATWQAALDPGRGGSQSARWAAAFRAGCRGTRPLMITAAALAVAGPWYALVTVRTGGEWLQGFLLIHNLARFSGPMEGHSGSAFLYYPLVLLLGMFPWSMASALVGHHAVRTASSTAGHGDEPGMRLLVAWIVAWVVPFSLSGTKLPGYVWPAYPALAGAVGLFVANWIRSPHAATDAWMRWSWSFLAASGVALGIGLPIAARFVAPEAAWLGLVGLVPLGGAVCAWWGQSRGSRVTAAAAWAATACGTVGLLVAAGPSCLGRAGGTRQLVARLTPSAAQGPIHVGSYRAPPSTSFYAGRLTANGSVTELKTPPQVAAFLAAHPQAHLVVDARFEHQVGKVLPPGYQVLNTVTSLPSARRLLLMGPAPDGPAQPLAVASSGFEETVLLR